MSVHPIEYRYFYPEMKLLFTEEYRLQKWLDVEAALAQAHADLGDIPREAAEEISRKASVKYVKLQRVKEIEDQIHHDLMAMVKALTEVCEGGAGAYVHLGATSYDIEDTATALQLKEAIKIILDDLINLKDVVVDLADKYKTLVCVGRTHGQHALPTTYGLKFAIWAYEIHRHIIRLIQLKPRVLVGKMTGAVGTMAGFGEKGFQIQELVMRKLGLKPAETSNQIVQRDRIAELILFTALVAATLNKIGKELRNLQRTEIGEVWEEFKETQVGSSTMPHKRNPHKSERICGLSRILIGNVFPALENVALEHERDLTNSAPERIIIPENLILLDYMLKQLTQILKNIKLDEFNITRNLGLTRGLIMAEKIMLELVNKGLGRQQAHELLRRCAMISWSQRIDFKQALLNEPEIASLVTPGELDEWLNPISYIGTAVSQVEKAVQELRGYRYEL
ncbi:MAG: adenylosuccinate lyase [Candidatus Odinarchaeum yellowstonii]|uniref:Adenylosuccinate lyase n=1 Tax=Odinarchaeota yellowstonii (strain LCB_4) TaxID=1841599 RepID=A0AAF0D3S1_ODILC|nr:MAG: adenylosuccinate lyase [Candidatus Odinarchaeum yellowstonii]